MVLEKTIVAQTLKWPSGLVCLVTCTKTLKNRPLETIHFCVIIIKRQDNATCSIVNFFNQIMSVKNNKRNNIKTENLVVCLEIGMLC